MTAPGIPVHKDHWCCARSAQPKLQKCGKSHLGGFVEKYFGVFWHINQNSFLWVTSSGITSSAKYRDLKIRAQLNINKHRKSFLVLLFLPENHSTKPPSSISLTFISFIKMPEMETRFMWRKCNQSQELILEEKMHKANSLTPANGIQLPGNLHVLLTACFIGVTVILYFTS